MTQVIAKPGESFESLVHRFKKATERDGILADLRKHEYYEKPSVQKKRKSAAAKKRSQKQQRIKARYAKSGQNFKYNKDKTKKIPIQPPKKGLPFKRKPSQDNRNDRSNSRPYDNRPKLMPRDNSNQNRRS